MSRLPSPIRLLATWFGVWIPVDRLTYAASGVGLMLAKYLAEASLFWVLTSSFLAPWDFVNPLATARESLLQALPPWASWAFYLWTLPFIWIAVSMSIRRAADAGMSPWHGFFVLVPLVNLMFMLALCLSPSRPGDPWRPSATPSAERHPASQAAFAVAASVILGGFMLVVSVYLLTTYGASLFLGTPLLMGATAAYFSNRSSPRSFPESAGIGAASVLFGMLAMLLFALEGLICLAMAAPMVVPVAAFGGILGKAIADATTRPARDLAAILVLLPLWAAEESWLASAPEQVVLTAVEIDAPPAAVWNNVIAFPDLPQQRPWYFALGIACPERARIDGEGVGATRHCEFTTGTFVEPITAWDEPNLLAFDVTEQPPPMFELTPYRHVHPPHLEGALQSSRGEFRLIALPGNRTRLEGRTWYRCQMFPQWYWRAWTDFFIHRIHLRVLHHIERVSEAPAEPADSL